MLGNFAFLPSADYYQNQPFREKIRNIIRVANRLDPDQVRRFVWPNLGPNCLQKLSADDNSRSAGSFCVYTHIYIVPKITILDPGSAYVT